MLKVTPCILQQAISCHEIAGKGKIITYCGWSRLHTIIWMHMNSMVVSPISNLVYCSCIRNITLLLATDLKMPIKHKFTFQYKIVRCIS